MAMILVDAPVFAAWVSDPDRLGPERVALLASAEGVALSGMALAEIGEKVREGAVRSSLPLRLWLELALEGASACVLPLTPAVVARASRLPAGDLGDRIFLATALEHDLEVATINPLLQDWPGLRYRF